MAPLRWRAALQAGERCGHFCGPHILEPAAGGGVCGAVLLPGLQLCGAHVRGPLDWHAVRQSALPARHARRCAIQHVFNLLASTEILITASTARPVGSTHGRCSLSEVAIAHGITWQCYGACSACIRSMSSGFAGRHPDAFDDSASVSASANGGLCAAAGRGLPLGVRGAPLHVVL